MQTRSARRRVMSGNGDGNEQVVLIRDLLAEMRLMRNDNNRNFSELRGEIEQTNARLEQTNTRLDQTNTNLEALRDEMHDGFSQLRGEMQRGLAVVWNAHE